MSRIKVTATDVEYTIRTRLSEQGPDDNIPKILQLVNHQAYEDMITRASPYLSMIASINPNWLPNALVIIGISIGLDTAISVAERQELEEMLK